ncbi:MAG TPA: AgmX/PglI C-terminal domain-containing protein, partial [Polyangiaceae bacterium]|nr:AgmX/PglI C-terminal domain-containing protein [Polyangiaceae bacterium]
MASLHPAAGSPAAFDHRVFSAAHNPFLKAEVELAPPALPSLSQNAALAESVEVTVLWGQDVLSVAQLTPPRKYAVGEVGGSDGAGTSPAGDVDFALSAERLGGARREIVAVRAGLPYAIFAGHESPRVFEKGRAVDASSAIVDCSDVAPGARGIELRQDRVVLVEASGLTFRLAGCDKPERVPRAGLAAADRSAFFTMGTAAMLQGLLVASLAYLTPSMAWGDESELDKDRLVLMQQYLHASQVREEEQQTQSAERSGGEQGAPAERNRGPEGKAGSPSAKQPARMAIKGDSAERAVSRAELVKEATDFGTIGLLNAMNASDAPSSPWGADLATGPDNVNAVGDLFSANIGEGIGTGGLGLSGGGLGGGGKGVGVGMGNIGTCMGLNCYGNGEGGFGRSLGRNGGEHKMHSFTVKPAGDTTLSGRLPPDVVQRIVRQNFGRFRNCYEMGLRTNPNLTGRVVARFVIGRDGAVSNVSAGGDLPDSQVRSCVASAFYGLSFPSP